MKSVIGRKAELALLQKIIKSDEAELLALYGRRRVGKTFLIRHAFQKQLVFEFSGIRYAKELENKLKVFRDRTKTRKTLFLTMVTTYGVKNPTRYSGLVQNEVTMAALF
jgi:AAA+ ATPase superfamily predicted ATPase